MRYSIRGKDVGGTTYGFGLNLADIWKRTFTQILTKGIVLEHWGHKIYWVVQEPVYQDFLNRYRLHGMTYDPQHSTVFAIYDLKRTRDRYELYQTRIESSTVDDLFDAFRTNFAVPSKQAFMQKLKRRIEKNAKTSVRLKLELE
jgi:hypothetical protein